MMSTISVKRKKKHILPCPIMIFFDASHLSSHHFIRLTTQQCIKAFDHYASHSSSQPPQHLSEQIFDQSTIQSSSHSYSHPYFQRAIHLISYASI